jgi:hypothetical protein
LGAAQEVLELWRVHTEHINRVRVFENGERAEVARPGGLLMDGPVTKALQLGAAHEALKL